MAVIVECKDPVGLNAKIKNAVTEGDIDTWIVDSDGDFTHEPDQWNCKAWMHFTNKNNLSEEHKEKLVFGIVGNKNVKMTKSLYAVYHGRFAEMLLSHFDDDIKNITIISNKTQYDFF